MKTVVFGANDKMYDKGTGVFYDVIKNPDYEYYCFFPSLKDSRNLSIAFSKKVTKFTCRPLKKIIYYNVLKHKYLKTCKRDDEILFLFSMYKMEDEYYFPPFIAFLKAQYKNAKFAYYSYDIASTWHTVTPNYIKDNFDIVLTFDESDAEKYGFEFYEGIYSKVDIETSADDEKSDLMFIGADKGKFPLLLKAFEKLSDKGIKCDFRLVEVDKENEEYLTSHFNCTKYDSGEVRADYKDSHFYINQYCPYYKTLKILNNSKAMLDIPLGTQNGSTIRLSEASVYEKKLITNCKDVAKKPFYKKENICIVDNPWDVDADFINSPFVPIDFDFSPIAMIDYAKSKLFPKK
jgi:hypothetical protein